MSEALTEPTPTPFPADPTEFGSPPGDGTAASEGSADATRTIPVERFNGLMSAHQRALNALDEERRKGIALQAQLQEKETQMPENDATLTEVQSLRAMLETERNQRYRAEVLARYPSAAPFADLIQGDSPAEIEAVAQAIAQRMEAIIPAATPPETPEASAPAPVAPVVPAAPAPQVPLLAGGSVAPDGQPTQDELLRKSLDIRNYDQAKGTDAVYGERFMDYLAGKLTPQQAQNLA